MMLHTAMTASKPLLPARPAEVRADQAPGYLLSSYELRSGLDVTALAVHQVPAEVLLELQRLIRQWPAAPEAKPKRH